MEVPFAVPGQVFLDLSTIQQPQRISELVQRLLDEAVMVKKDIDGIAVTGKDPDIAPTQELLERIFPGKKTLNAFGFDRGQSIIYGTALQGYYDKPAEVQEWDDEVLCGLPMNVNMLPLGFELSNGAFVPVIPNGTIIPTGISLKVTTTVNNQEKIVLRIFEGLRKIAAKNQLLGTIELTGIPTSMEPTDIEIAFELGPQELLTVIAKGADGLVSGELTDLMTGRRGREELRGIQKEAERFHEEDLQRLRDFPLEIKDGVQNAPKEPFHEEPIYKIILREIVSFFSRQWRGY